MIIVGLVSVEFRHVQMGEKLTEKTSKFSLKDVVLASMRHQHRREIRSVFIYLSVFCLGVTAATNGASDLKMCWLLISKTCCVTMKAAVCM